MLGVNLKREIDQIAKDKGIDSNEIIAALEEAMVQAAHKRHGADKEFEARYNDELGEIEIFEFREVVDELSDASSQILIEVARGELDPEAEVGDEIGVKLDTADFGRILAQTAKQVIIQRIRDAERDNTFEEYSGRQGEIVNGVVRRFEKGSLIIDLGRAEAVLPPKEQVPRENYRPGDRVRAYVQQVTKATKGPQIILSRSCLEMLTKLFEQEVPEIYERIVTIEAAAREPGGRSKVAVSSRDSDVDPVGACVGMKGSRVQAVVQELRGERIDIVPWSSDPARYVCSALSPAQVSKVIIDEATQSMDVIVPDDQLSLAIGRRGQNVRLAVQLTNWRIDIKSETKMRELARWLSEAISIVEGCGDPEAELLLQQGITSLEDLGGCPDELLLSIPGIDEASVASIKSRALELVTTREEEEERLRLEAIEAIEEHAREEAARLATEAAEAEASAAAEAPSADLEATGTDAEGNTEGQSTEGRSVEGQAVDSAGSENSTENDAENKTEGSVATEESSA